MIRYQIRNEYGLSDPELYAPGEKDDPEALLEGVAMAGLVGVLRQLGDLAEFAAEIFHDLHEDVMATASRGHGLMLRLQQLEAEFPAVEKAIISQTDHSNYPHDDGVEWHANFQLNQNMITQGDMPRFILDSYEECRGPPRLFTLDKFDVAGAGASLKRYSDPSFFKTEHISNMIESDGLIEKKPRKIKKKAMRWRKGETLESLLVANSESHSTTSKDRAARKVPPRTTKLKYRNPRDSDRKTISRICREQLQEVISSQQKILFNYSPRLYNAKFRPTDSSEMAASFGERDGFNAPTQSSSKLELTKVVPINENDTTETESGLINGPICLKADDEQFLATQYGPVKVEEVRKRSTLEQNGIYSASEELQEGPDFKGQESDGALQLAGKEELQLAVVPVNQDVDCCIPDDIGSDHENFVDALNNMESEGEVDREVKTKTDLSAKIQVDKLKYYSKEGENASHIQFPELGLAIDLSSELNDSCNEGKSTCCGDSFLCNSSNSAGPTTKYPNSGSPCCRQSSDIDWTNDEEPFNDVDLMDVSSSSSVLSVDNANFETDDNPISCEQSQDAPYHSSNDHVAVAHNSDKQSSERSDGLDGLTINSNDGKAYNSLVHGQNFVLNHSALIFDIPNDLTQEEIEVANADDLLLHHTIPNQGEIEFFKEQFEECTSLDGSASLADMGPVMHMNDLESDNVAIPQDIAAKATPTALDSDGTHRHLDELDLGVAPIHLTTLNNPLYESHNDEIVEELHALPDDDLYKHIANDQEIIMLGKGPSSTSIDTHKEDPVKATSVPRDFSHVQELPGLNGTVSPPQDGTEAHVDDTLAPSPSVLNDDTKPLFIGSPLASSAASLLDTSSSCLEHCESTVIGKTGECGEVLVSEESTTGTFEDILMPCEEVSPDGDKCTEKAVVLAANSVEEKSNHDVQIQSISCMEDVETAEATSENFGSIEESEECIFKGSVSQTDNLAQLIDIETTREAFCGGDDIQCLSLLHFPEKSVCQGELPEDINLNAEVPCQHDLDKDGGVVSPQNNMVQEQPCYLGQDGAVASLRNNMVVEQPPDDEGLITEQSVQDSFGTNPFMDPGYMLSHTQTDPSPSTSYLQCFSVEEQDFISELLTQHGDTGAKDDPYPLVDSLWEPATPPDEAPLPSELMTEEDFRSFCHEYHEIDFTDFVEGFDDKPSSDSNKISNGYMANMASEQEIHCSASALPVGLGQEACICSKPDSLDPQLSESPSAPDISSKIPSSTKENPDKTPGVSPDGLESFCDEKIHELDVPFVQLELEKGQDALSGVDSYSGSLLNNDKIVEIYGSFSGDVVPVKEEQEACGNLVSHAFVFEKLDKLDGDTSSSIPVKPVVETRGLDEYDFQDIPYSSINEVNGLGALPLSKPVLTSESELCCIGELDSQVVSSSLINEIAADQDNPPFRITLEAKQESEDCVSGEHVPRIATSLVNGKMDELDAPPLSNAVLVEKGPEVCVLDSEIAPLSLTNEKIYEQGGPFSSGSALVDLESEDNVSGGLDSLMTVCSSVHDKVDEPDAAVATNLCLVEPEQEAFSSPADASVATTLHPIEQEKEDFSSPELIYDIAACSLNDDKVGKLDEPPSCNAIVESENGSNCSDVFDTQVPTCSSNSGLLAETSTMTYSLMPSTEEKYMYSPVSPPTEPFTNFSCEDHQKPPPLPPLQWRRSRLGLVSIEGLVPEPVRTMDPMLPTSNPEIDNRLGSPNGMAELTAPVSSQENKEMHQSSVVDNDQRVEFGRISALQAVTGVATTEDDRTFSEPHENIVSQRTMSSLVTEAEEHLNDMGVSDGTALHQSYSLVQAGPQQYILSSDTSDGSGQLSHTYQAALEDDKTVDDHNATGGTHLSTINSSTSDHVSGYGCYQQPHRGELFLETIQNKEHSSKASYEEENLKYQPITSGATSTISNHSAPGSVLEEGNNHEGQNLQEQNAENSRKDQYEGPSSRINMERENVYQPSLVAAWTDLAEGGNVHAEQPPVMGWTIRPQMLHPNYGISEEESPFEPEVTDHQLIRKPISIKNIPRNPLVDAVAAHDRSTMRKVSELVVPADKPKANERNLLLEQIRNKTFNLKPVGSSKPTAIRAPARSSTRNLKVAAIIEKANAIRQAVGSDDDGDSWSDT